MIAVDRIVTEPQLVGRRIPGIPIDHNTFIPTDAHGRVRGVLGLTVADASLMPTIPSSNIHLPTLMIGERIGGWLRDSADG